MSQIETLGILDEIQALVSDHLQVVSYKWLSRNFLVSSNAAKRLLEDFVQKHGSGLEVVYTLAGWLKSSPPSYNIRLVSGPKLQEAKQEFDGNCSVQVYSVQACIPKDPAALWNAEFVQAEELFKQPSTFDNCLRDNRFCGISNSFIKRNVDGTPVSIAAAHPRTSGIPQPSKSNFAIQNSTVTPQQNKVPQSSPTVVKDVKGESNGTKDHGQPTKPSADKEKIHILPAGKKKGQNDKSSSGSGSSLANLWDRASAKSKPDCAPADDKNLVSNSTVNAEAQICAREAVENGSSDDDAEDVNFRRASNGEGNRKRKVVFDLSDEDESEDAVNLASPDSPKGQSCLDPKQIKKPLVTEKPDLILNKLKVDKPEAKEEKTTDQESNQSLRENSAIVSKGMSTEISSTVKTEKCAPENGIDKDKVVNSVPNSSKRRKVLKTRIDERGREVTEVVWEGEEAETKRDDNETTKKADSNPTKKADSNTVTNNVNRPSAPKKLPAIGSTALANPGSKAGIKKNQKDPKQGNLLSFFKRVRGE